MTPKVSKGIRDRKVPLRDTQAYRDWHHKLIAGMRKATLRRRKSGLLTVREAAHELCLSVANVRQMGFRSIKVGRREFLWRSEIERWKRQTGAEDAA